jgi:3-deoxy-7-phosphoheptulonate synthase
MIIVLKPEARREDAEEILADIARLGLKPLYLPGVERTVLGALGDERVLRELALASHPLVEQVTPVLTPYKLASRELKPADTVVRVGTLAIGGPRFAVIAGPCAVEDAAQLAATARGVQQAGAQALRGGAYKPRSSPYAFQGHGAAALDLLAAAREATGLPVVSEVLDAGDIPAMLEHVDALQVGARNMQNFRLLQALGAVERPVLLKRGLVATLEELLLAAEYVLAAGNPDVILCERGIRTFARETRNTLDLAAIPLLKQRTHLPVIADPSHGTGIAALVPPLAQAALAAGADGLMIEVHPDPAHALSDGPQSLTPAEFAGLMRALGPLAAVLGRTIAAPARA